MSNIKTNAMRILEKYDISYKVYTYDTSDGFIDGLSVAKKLGIPVEKMYKTLVTQGNSGEYYVFIIQVEKELNLKKAAKVIGEKSVSMIRVNEINKVTGYIRGGCSPIGMKKNYKTVMDSSANSFSEIVVSAGKIGYQIEVDPKDLIRLIQCTIVSVTT